MNQYKAMWAQWGILNHEQYAAVIAHFGDLKAAWENVSVSFLKQLGFREEKSRRILEIKQRLNIYDLFKTLESLHIEILSIDEEEYPKPLKSIYDPPPFLFIRGRLPLLHKALGVVGTRKITEYGKLVTEKLVTGLTKNQFIIVSGLAMGVDTCAHEITLKQKGVTIGILGSGVDEIYPRTNQRLAQKIMENKGVILSEYPLGTMPARHHFPARNRIIAGLSRGVLITEGGIKSGALITARFALDQGREVFAVPHNITKKELSGTNYLIRQGEAKLVEAVEHILEEFKLSPLHSKPRKIPLHFSAKEAEIIELVTNEGKSMDELIQKTSYNITDLSITLTDLQLKGVIREIHQKWTLV